MQKWLVVLADCFHLQKAFDVLALDRVMDESPTALNARRHGLEADVRPWEARRLGGAAAIGSKAIQQSKDGAPAAAAVVALAASAVAAGKKYQGPGKA